jgi:hypothetical protein
MNVILQLHYVKYDPTSDWEDEWMNSELQGTLKEVVGYNRKYCNLIYFAGIRRRKTSNVIADIRNKNRTWIFKNAKKGVNYQIEKFCFLSMPSSTLLVNGDIVSI